MGGKGREESVPIVPVLRNDHWSVYCICIRGRSLNLADCRGNSYALGQMRIGYFSV